MSLCFHNKNRKNPFNFFDFLIECSERGGAASGTCAAGFGVCCVFLTSSCGSTVKENCTYIRYLRFNNVISVVEFKIILEMIGVQSNHGIEHFGGPVAPTQRFQHNQRIFRLPPLAEASKASVGTALCFKIRFLSDSFI